MYYTGSVIVKFKKSVLEPQGKAIELSLKENHINGIEKVRVGKIIEVSVEAESEAEAQVKINEIAEGFLYNSVMETFDVKMVEL